MRVPAIALVIYIAIARVYAFNLGSNPEAWGAAVNDEHRREFLGALLATAVVKPLRMDSQSQSSRRSVNGSINGIHDPQLRDYRDSLLPNWQGTSLPGPLTLAEAYSRICDLDSEPVFCMGKWPDPILRRPSSYIPASVFRNKVALEQLQGVARALRNTARNEGAVGLAAQQCGVNASLVFIDGVNSSTFNNKRPNDGTKDIAASGDMMRGVFGQSIWRNSQREILGEGYNEHDLSLAQKTARMKRQNQRREKGIFLVNPRIIRRSPESEMLVWTEQCLVLPPEFRATLLRDAEVTIEYESLECMDVSSGSCGRTEQISLSGELARCAQHEMDHDRGTLIVDHVALGELLAVDGNAVMAEIENADGLHEERVRRAYSRELSNSILLPPDEKMVPLAMENRFGYSTKVKQIHSQCVNRDRKRPWFIQSANAIEQGMVITTEPISPRPPNNTRSNPSQSAPNSNSSDCNEECLEERKRLVEQRRAIMQQSRSNTRRGDLLELSRQRASLYETEFRGLPPQYCVQPGYCP